MKTAFTVWNDRISPLFDVSGEIHLVESEAGRIKAQSRVCLDDPMPALKVRRLADMDVGMLVCGAISRMAQDMVTAYGIELVAFINGDLDTVMDAWQHDKLRADVLRMPGCKSPFRRGYLSGKPAAEELKMKNRQGGGRYQNRNGKGRGGKGAVGQGCVRPYGGRNRPDAHAAICICPKCGRQAHHQQGMPCVDQPCPDCGATMTRK
jgi:predicted Fe-Mo cluster-binding NifX family protein